MIDAPILFVVFKALIGFGLPIAFGIHQLVSIRRSIRADREAAARDLVEEQHASTTVAAPPAKAA